MEMAVGLLWFSNVCLIINCCINSYRADKMTKRIVELEKQLEKKND